MEWLAHQYARLAPWTVAWRVPLLGGAVALLAGTTWLFASQGAEFVPRIFEGDAMVTIRRAPSVSLPEARRLDLMVENVLHTFPEIVASLGMTGRAEVAIDPVGNDNTDVLIRLRPMKEWKTAADFDGLSEAIKNAVETQVPGTFTSVSQPIEDKTNELISGSRADVAVQLYGPGLEELAQLADRVGDRVRRIPGAGDVRIERLMGQPIINAVANRQSMARHGVTVEDAFMVLQASREGVPTGALYEGQKRFDLRVLQPPRENTAEALGELFVETASGISVPLSEVVTLAETDGPTAIRRLDRQRVVRIDVNLRGRDLVSFVDEARAVIAREFPLPPGYRVEYGGQFENFARAQKRLALVIPGVVVIILGMLLWMFRNLRFALPVFLMVPFSLSGGMLGLLARGMPFSLPAAVGFIALGGIAVLNGVVIATEVRALMHKGMPLGAALEMGASNVVRAVLTTAAVAALGFLPMALATSAGAEVQQPLATVVIVGILFGTLLTLLVLPGMLSFFLAGYVSDRDVRVEPEEDPPVALAPAHL
jgi:cobalt-zinc-cadmium resistance protein CzcA